MRDTVESLSKVQINKIYQAPITYLTIIIIIIIVGVAVHRTTSSSPPHNMWGVHDRNLKIHKLRSSKSLNLWSIV